MMISDVYYHFNRDLIKWLRGRIFVVTSLITPAAWLIFVGLALPTTFTNDYIDFVAPGIMVMTMLNSSLQGGSLLIFDKVLGFLNKFLALPSPRETILFGKIVFITFRGLLQATVILLMAILLGVRFPGVANLVYVYFVLAIFGLLFSAIACAIALVVDDHDGYSAFNSMVGMPLYFASTALMPYSSMPSWLRVVASLNPVSYAIDTTRSAFSGTFTFGGTIVIAAMAAVVLTICIYMFRRATV